ncbi:hypothetical protein F3Y22_tig00116951pilonHSYRG00341 [Hibiscus syriacus]|uniref:Pentatricopeptide repeat-containing protein n=1 Tax=Hibiscus syriacus TaxID=106335 RepID=A0A6A2WMI6_HIBSY|nr:putative pentatricopeptide repeat-containing protein At1g12700, mitochondrial [Hibiscus syriacus]KAE8660531.1 hypothetical protein F3Y22_tig00116951pilonHSYRG00341 [Hibiscus syriacus]
MGKLISSLILVNARMNLSISRSSFSSIATIFDVLPTNPVCVREKYNEYNSLTLFLKSLDKEPKRSIVEFNKSLRDMVGMKHYADAVSMCSEMDLVGVSHDAYSLNILIHCFCQLGQTDFGFSVLGKMLKLGVEPDVVTLSALISGLCMRPNILEADKLFHEMIERGYQPRFNFTVLILCRLLKIIKAKRAVSFLRMVEETGIEHDTVAYTSVIDSYCKEGLLQEEALHLVSQMRDKGIRPIVDTYTFLMHAIYKSEGAATRVLTDMMDYKISLNISLYNILINAQCKEGMIFKAMDTIDTMRKQGIEPHVVTYNILIAALCDKGVVPEAEAIVHTMEKRGIKLGFETYSILVDAHCKDGMVPKAEGIAVTMRKLGIEPDVVTYNIFIDALCKKGMVSEAEDIFATMAKQGVAPDLVTYRSLIGALYNEGMVSEAEYMLDTMEKQGIGPDGVRYDMLIPALSKAKDIVDKMRKRGIEPCDVTYNILVDAYWKEGMVTGALDVISTMRKQGIEPDDATCNALVQFMTYGI